MQLQFLYYHRQCAGTSTTISSMSRKLETTWKSLKEENIQRKEFYTKAYITDRIGGSNFFYKTHMRNNLIYGPIYMKQLSGLQTI